MSPSRNSAWCFFDLAKEVVDPKIKFHATAHGDFVLLVCGAADQVLVIPRFIILEMLTNVPTRKLDVFCENNAYILQTTRHPKLNVTEFLNAFPNLARDEQGMLTIVRYNRILDV